MMTTSETADGSTAGHMHRYEASCSWTGTTSVGYEGYERNHAMRVPGVTTPVDLSSDGFFHGDSSRLNPEVLLVAAASSCQLLSFLAVAARARLDVVGYEDKATGEMPEQRAPTGLTSIVLRPVILLRSSEGQSEEELVARLEHLTQVAHRECFIANSLKTPVTVEASFEFVD